MSESRMIDEQVLERLKDKMNYREDRHCSSCKYATEKDIGWHECHLSPLFPFRVFERASCSYHQNKGRQ